MAIIPLALYFKKGKVKVRLGVGRGKKMHDKREAIKTRDEKRRMEEAKKWGMFRELQWFQGIAYDDQTGEVLGDVEIWDKVNGKVKYTGVIRGCSQARANSEYIREGLNGSTDGNWVVVIGAREERQLGKVLVVAELNQAGRAGLERISGTH